MFVGSVTSVLKSQGVVEGGTGAIAKEIDKANNTKSNIDIDEDYKENTAEI